jgi:amidophosphoribosyltransferase
MLGADSLKFLSIEDLKQTVKHAKVNFCMGCFTGEYPEKIAKNQNEQMRIE